MELLQKIHCMVPPDENVGSNRISLAFSKDGVFLVELAYSCIAYQHNIQPHQFWKKLWRWQGPERVCSFLWLLSKQKLLTNKERKTHGMTRNDLCPRCGLKSETALHMVRDCELVSNLWLSIIKP